MDFVGWLADLLRDSIWNGIVGVITILTVLFALFRFVVNVIRGIRTQQGFIDSVTKTMAEIAGWARKLIDFVFTRGWKVQVLISALIFLIIWSQQRATLDTANLLGALTVACWLLARTAYKSAKEIRNLREERGKHRLECLPLGNIAIADDFTRRYPTLSLGEKSFNGVPFLLSARYFNTSATEARFAELKVDKPIRRLSSMHLLINAGNAWKRHQETNLDGVAFGRIQLFFKDGTSQETKLILGQNVREWAPGNKPGELVDRVIEQLSQVAWTGRNGSGNEAVIDQLEIPVRKRHRGKELERLAISRDTKPNMPEDILAFSVFAITLEYD